MSDSDTRHSRYVKWIMNNRILAVLVLIGSFVIAAATFTDALDTLAGAFSGDSNERAEQEYCELLAPLTVQFDRTLDAFRRYKARDFAVEGTLVDGNQKALDLLTTKPYLVAVELTEARDRLVSHYDIWLEEYRRVRQISADSVQAFIFVGPQGHGFPRGAERLFRSRADSLETLFGAEVVCG